MCMQSEKKNSDWRLRIKSSGTLKFSHMFVLASVNVLLEKPLFHAHAHT